MGPSNRIQRDSLQSFLARGLDEFLQGGQLGDGGRLGMHTALNGLLLFAKAAMPPNEKHKLYPILCLMGALSDLDHGRAHPALMPATRRHRPRDLSEVRDFKALCIVVADLLHRHGTWKGRKPTCREADRAVFACVKSGARRLRIKTRNGFAADEKSIETWRATLRKERRLSGAHSFLACEVDQLEAMARSMLEYGFTAQKVAERLLMTLAEANFAHWPAEARD